ncbi:MAG: glycosyltransferase [Acidobacteria bacterium]|nr:glycosyltransferase [Acidobacteriota bacterium]
MPDNRELSYKILELEVERPLPEVTVPPGYSGLAFVIRHRDMVVGFCMEALAEGTALSPDELAARVMKHAAAHILSERIYEELRGLLLPLNAPSLDIAICTHNRADVLKRCLESLTVAQGFSSVRVLVVDNAPSDDRTRQVVADFPKVDYVVERTPGLDFARNRALRESTAELIAFLDDDVVVDRRWLQGLGEAWAGNPDAGAFTGPVLPFELETRAQILFEQMGGFGRSFDRARFGPLHPELPTYPCGAGMFGAGCNMVFRRRVLVELGGFDDALDTGAPLPGGGDLDMFYRVVRAGYPLVREPKLVVYHQHRREYAKLRHQMWTWGLGSMAYVSKSWRTDPSERPKIRRWILWWFAYQLSKIFVPFLRRNRRPLPWDLVAAEIAGGIVGLLGEYDRSRSRVDLLRREYA